MFSTRHEILAAFRNPELIQHPNHPPGVRTFSCLPAGTTGSWSNCRNCTSNKRHRISQNTHPSPTRFVRRRCSFTFSRIVSGSGSRWTEPASFIISPATPSGLPDRDCWASWSGASATPTSIRRGLSSASRCSSPCSPLKMPAATGTPQSKESTCLKGRNGHTSKTWFSTCSACGRTVKRSGALRQRHGCLKFSSSCLIRGSSY